MDVIFNHRNIEGSSMTSSSPGDTPAKVRFSLDTWAVVSATLLVLLIVSGVLPFVPC
jgi:hypothetical protein